jgi:polar amino acid transport system substrate-binding protein
MMLQLHKQQWQAIWQSAVWAISYLRLKLKIGLYCGGLLALTVAATSTLATEEVRLVTKQWPGYTNPDLSGGYFELVHLVLPSDKFQLKTEFSNFNRAVTLVQKEQAELVLAVTRVDGKHLLLSEYPMDADRIVAVYRGDMQAAVSAEMRLLAQLSKYRLAWDLAYNYGRALGLDVKGYEVTSVRQGLELVSKGRVDVYLAEQSDLELPESQVLLQHLKLQQEPIQQLPVYVGFPRSVKGLKLKRYWDHQFRLLLKQGKLQTLYLAYPGMVLATTVPDCAVSVC